MIERKIVIACIESSVFIKSLKLFYDRKLIESDHAKKIIDWCFEYHDRYGKAPEDHIQDIYENNRDDGKFDDDTAEWLEDVLASLSDEGEEEDEKNQQDYDYLLDATESHFKKRDLYLLSERLKAAADSGEVTEAEGYLLRHKLVERPRSRGVDPFRDEALISSTFDYVAKPLFVMPGLVGSLMNDQFVEDSFITFLAPEKRGKSWWLAECAFRALKQRVDVAIFQCGDMSEMQMTMRLQIRASMKSNKAKYCKEQWVPCLDCVYNQNDTCEMSERESDYGLFPGAEEKDFKKIKKGDIVQAAEDIPGYVPCSYCSKNKLKSFKGTAFYKLKQETTPLTKKEALESSRKFAGRAGKLKLDTYSNSSLTVSMMDNVLDMWERLDNFRPKLIVIDYADLLVSENTSWTTRDQINDVWKALRRISQDRKCCVLTATQADAASYDEESLGIGNFSEDKRKWSHITAGYGLNQTPEEKRKGIMRLAPLLLREDDFDSLFQAHVLYHLPSGRCLIDSY